MFMNAAGSVGGSIFASMDSSQSLASRMSVRWASSMVALFITLIHWNGMERQLRGYIVSLEGN